MLFCWESGFPKEHHSKQNKKLPCRRSLVLEGSSLFSERSTSLFIYLFIYLFIFLGAENQAPVFDILLAVRRVNRVELHGLFHNLW